MSRLHKDFITSWTDYADNGHAPRIFHLWSAVSMLACALERKVWIPLSDVKMLYPNFYMFLVARPGIGKSSALDNVTSMLEDMNRVHSGRIKILPQSLTEAKFIDTMAKFDSYTHGSKVVRHSSAYFPASEASNSFQIKPGSGSLTEMFTDLYDSPPTWVRATQKDGEYVLFNSCINILAGCTFDFLGKLITNSNIQGGFASRITYVIFDEILDRNTGLVSGISRTEREQRRTRLLADLTHIHKNLKGEMIFADCFKSAFDTWYRVFNIQRQKHPSENMQAILTRKHISIMKLAMILSVSESDEMTLYERHFKQALNLTDQIEQELPKMLRVSATTGNRNSQENLLQTIFSQFDKLEDKELPYVTLKGNLVNRGFQPKRVEETLNALVNVRTLVVVGDLVRLSVNADSYL